MSGRLLTWRFARILLAQTTFGFGWSFYLLIPKFYATELGASAETIGWLASMSGLFAVITTFVAAGRIDRHGRKPLFRFGSLLVTTLSCGYLTTSEIGPLLFLFHGLLGSAFVLAFNAAATLAADEAPAARLGQALGLLGASNMIMNAVSTVIAEHLAAAVGWGWVFGLGAVAGLLAFALSFSIREAPPSAPGSAASQGHVSARPGRLSLSPIAAPLLAAALMGSAFSAVFVFYQPYALSLGATALRDFFVGFTASAVAVRVFFGNLGDRYGRQLVSSLFACLYAASAASMIALDPTLLLAYGALFGLAHGVLYPTLNAVVMERVPGSGRGRAMTFYNGAFNAGMGLSNLGWGALAERRGFPTVFVAASCVGLSCAALLSLPQLANMRNRRADVVDPSD